MKTLGYWLGCGALSLGISAASVVNGQGNAVSGEPVRLVQKIKAPTLNQIGHIDIDEKRNRLLIPVAGTHTLEIVELTTGRLLPPLTMLGAPKDVMYLPEFDAIVVSSGSHGKVFFFDAETLNPSGSVSLERNCNYLRYDPKAREIYVANGVGIISVIDAEARTLVRKIELGKPIGSYALEMQGDRLFVNIPSLGTVAVVNRRTGEEIARWPIDESIAGNNVVMAYDEPNQRLFIACRKPPRFVVMDAKTGSVIAVLPMIGDCEDMVLDQRTQRIYATCGVGTIDVFKEASPGKFQLEARIPTATAARTSVFVPDRRLLYVPVPASRGEASQIHIYEVEPFTQSATQPADADAKPAGEGNAPANSQ